jgi:hypothetical protein
MTIQDFTKHELQAELARREVAISQKKYECVDWKQVYDLAVAYVECSLDPLCLGWDKEHIYEDIYEAVISSIYNDRVLRTMKNTE